MNASKAIVQILEKEGITAAFGIPGAGINGLYQYLAQSETIKHITHRHEECCVHAADGYFRSSGKMAIALSTSGPGATNFVTGLYTAMIDSIPLVAITGQAVSSQLGKDAFQCVDIASIAAPVCKRTWCVTEPRKLPAVFAEAFQLARSGKPGPVLIDMPLDTQTADISFAIQEYRSLPVNNPQARAADIKKAVDLIASAKKPLVLMGGGVVLSEACDDCVKLAEELNAPVITTYMAKGGISENHPLNAGHCGIQVGQPIGNKTFLDSDLVLGIGCRFTDRHTGALDVYRGDRKFIHINVEPSEIGKIFEPDLGIVSDAGAAIAMLRKEVAERGLRFGEDRVRQLAADRKALARKVDQDCVPIHPHRVFGEINKVLADKVMFTTGCGITQIWSGQLQQVSAPRTYLPSGGAGCLGYDIPAAIGAMAGRPERKACAVMGDFGFSFHAQELAVAAKAGLPIIVVIVNNAYLGLIRQNQKYAFGYEYAVEMAENQDYIDYVKVAEGFGSEAERVCQPDQIAPALERALAAGKPYVVEVICEPSADCSMGSALNNVKEFF